MHKFPLPSPIISMPSLSTSEGLTPKNGKVADPGFLAVMPAIGLINTEPVSYTHLTLPTTPYV